MRCALAALGLTLALAPGATAAQVSVTQADGCRGDAACTKYGGLPPVAVVLVADGAGQANRVTIARAGDVITVTDAAAPLTPGAGCTAVDAATVTCPARTVQPIAYSFPQVSVLLGAGDDLLATDGSLSLPLTVDAGDGVDAITGSAADDFIDGGPGTDRLDGGGGIDALDYQRRTAPVTVSLTAGLAGEAGERDAVAGFEIVNGGAGADVITGGPGADALRGVGGDDRVDGAGGADTVSGGTGNDTVLGGDGNDAISLDPEQGDDFYTPLFTPGNDTGDGGPGDDSITDGAGGRNVMRGGAGNDALLGSIGPDRLEGGDGVDRLQGDEGPDRLAGGPGKDALAGGPGADRFDGGSGDDRVDARDGLREAVLCGSGRDKGRFDRRDRLSACELRLR